MKQIYQDLWQAEDGDHFGMLLRTYLLTTKKGNAVIYYTNSLTETEHIKKLGGAKKQFLSHHHEFMPAMFNNLTDFNAQMSVHKSALPFLKQKVENIHVLEDNTNDFANIQVFHNPGHTNNNISLYYHSPYGKSYLFIGDTIFLDRGNFNYLIMPNEGGSKNELKESLLKLRELKVDVILPSVGVGYHEAIEVTQSEWHNIIDDIVNRLKV